MAKSNLAIRLASATVGIPGIVALLYLGRPWMFFVLVALATVVGATELAQMTHPRDRTSAVVIVSTTLAVFGALYFGRQDARVLLTLVLVLPLSAMLLTLWRLGDVATAAGRATAAAFHPIYFGGGMAALALLRLDGGADGPALVVLALTLSWFADAGAYFAGRTFGKRKLYEAVSPKKTVAGAVGGLVAATLGALVAPLWYAPSLPVAHVLIVAVVATSLGQLGDLGESLLKRSCGIKDSGAIVPGHGGILDRVDALLVTSTVTYLYLVWIRGV